MTRAVERGPYFQDFSDAPLHRSDVRESQAGIPRKLTLNVHQASGSHRAQERRRRMTSMRDHSPSLNL